MRQFFFLLLFIPSLLWGLVFDLPENNDNVVGEIKATRTRKGERIMDVGRRFDIGYFEMIEANPDWGFSELIPARTRMIIPAKFILPPGSREGIVINLAELRLYYYPKGQNKVITLPVGIGREGWNTPLGKTYIAQKTTDPVWRPTQNVKTDAAKHGIELPDMWPAGPDNPLGQFAMRLGWHTYLIHGTNDPNGVGRRSSAGCIRMFPEDIEELFAMVPLNTPVRIINEQTKVGKRLGKIYLEVHKPLKEKGRYVSSNIEFIKTELLKWSDAHHQIIDWSLVNKVAKKQSGLPTILTVNPG